MSDAKPAPNDVMTELKTSAYMMRLETGVYCVSHAEGSVAPDANGYPAARLSVPPGQGGTGVSLSGFHDGGWVAVDSAALIRIARGPAQVLMTVYQMPNSTLPAPRLQVKCLVEGAAAPATTAQAVTAAASPSGPTVTAAGGSNVPAEPEIAAHVQERGDVLARIGEWIGDRGSRRWIEGYAVAPRNTLAPDEIEYQAVLGRDWLSPWMEGGKYCGSRGMALPILGLRARLRGAAAATHRLELRATFTDGTAVGPVADGDACEADSLSPLEAFQITIHPRGEAKAAGKATGKSTKPAASAPQPTPAPAPPAFRAKPPVLATTKAGAAKPNTAKPAPAKAAPAKAAPAKAAPLKAASAMPRAAAPSTARKPAARAPAVPLRKGR